MDPNIPIDRQDVADTPKEYCDFCQTEITDDEEPRHITAGDEGLTLCEACAENCLD